MQTPHAPASARDDGEMSRPQPTDSAGRRLARIVQISDTHLSAALGPPPSWGALTEWLGADPPDLVVHSGDIVLEDPDDDADRAFAAALLAGLPAPVAVIPGNHDIGGYDGDDDRRRAQRLQAFVETWGADRFALDVAGWRVVGADAYVLGSDEHDEWLAGACSSGGPVAVFVHQPLWGDPADGWEMPAAAAVAFERAVAGADLRLVASGHRHCSAIGDRHGRRAVWAPSVRLLGDVASVGPELERADPRPGVIEHTLGEDGTHRSVVRHL